MSKVDVTAVVNAHREGLIAVRSLISASKAKAHAEQSGFQAEVIVVLDRPDALTEEVVMNWREKREKGVRSIYVDHGDAGPSRNDGVAEASGNWIAFLDADDLWCETWLSSALIAAARDIRNIVWHPEIALFFGRDPYIFRHVDMESDQFEISALLMSNHWTSLCMARRDLLLDVPHSSIDLKTNIGYEDWSWNLAAIENGAIHKIVPGTGHAIRQKYQSRNMMAISTNAISKPSGVFQALLRARELNSRSV